MEIDVKTEMYSLIMDLSDLIVSAYYKEILQIYTCKPNLYYEFIPWQPWLASQSSGNITINIGCLELNMGEHFYSKATLIKVTECVIHEMFHIEQVVDYYKYDNDSQYVNTIEQQTTFMSRLFIRDHLEEICSYLAIDYNDEDMIEEFMTIIAHGNNIHCAFEYLPSYPRFQNLHNMYLNYLSLALPEDYLESLSKEWDNFDNIALILSSTDDIESGVNGDGRQVSTTLMMYPIELKKNGIWQCDSYFFYVFNQFTGAINSPFIKACGITWYSEFIEEDNTLYIKCIRDNNSFDRINGFNIRTNGFVIANKEDIN